MWEEAGCRHAEGFINANMQLFACNDTFAMRQQLKSIQESSLLHAESGTLQPPCPVPRQDCVCIPAPRLCWTPAGFLQCPAKPMSDCGSDCFFPVTQVLDVSGASVLASAIPDCHVYILENCGHSVVVERPRKTANLILEFLALLHSIDNNKKQA